MKLKLIFVTLLYLLQDRFYWLIQPILGEGKGDVQQMMTPGKAGQRTRLSQEYCLIHWLDGKQSR